MTIGVGIVGMGFMGQTHAKAYTAASRDGIDCRVVGVADPNPERVFGTRSGNFETSTDDLGIDPETTDIHRSIDGLLEDDRVDLLSICTHTDTHVDLAIRALAAKKHVLVEKPIAIGLEDVQRLADAASASDRHCIPAMCMRFWPAWRWLREVVNDGRYGAVRSATFHRLGSTPAWTDFYADANRSGGAIFDLHVHDTDFIVHCFGLPTHVTSVGSPNHLTTVYHFEQGPAHVVAEGGWGHDAAFGFRMRFVVCCDEATIDFDLGRDPQLAVSQEHAGGVTHPDVGDATGYDGEVRHALALVAGDNRTPLASINEAVGVTRVLHAELQSARSNERVALV